MTNESESLLEPPIALDSTPNSGDMGRETIRPEVWSSQRCSPEVEGHGLSGRKGHAGIVDPVRNRIQANRGRLPPYVDNCVENTGKLAGYPLGFGWHEAYIPTNWRSRRSSLS